MICSRTSCFWAGLVYKQPSRLLLIYTAHSKDITQFFGVNSNVQHYWRVILWNAFNVFHNFHQFLMVTELQVFMLYE